MYVPPFNVVLDNLDIEKASYEAANSITLPKALFEFLIRLTLVGADFNEAGYLSSNPDVATAAQEGKVKNARLHYISNGYLEGRLGGSPALDENWYLKYYPDVADAVRRRVTQSGAQHYQDVGAGEFRAPSEAYLTDAVEWGKVFGKK
jgi:hypothetical protein